MMCASTLMHLKNVSTPEGGCWLLVFIGSLHYSRMGYPTERNSTWPTAGQGRVWRLVVS